MEKEGKVVFHVDVNSAYLSWEAAYRLHHLGGQEDLRNQIAAVGGDTALRHGIILAKSIPAKKYGILTGETILEAKRKCPELRIVPPNYGLYERCSKALTELLKEYSPFVEPYSIDESFMDMTGTEGLWGEPLAAANRIRSRISRELGFTVNIGISENKLLAKMAGDLKKPDQVHTLWKREIPSKMWPLPVRSLFFVGNATEKKLSKLGIRTIGELAEANPDILKSHLKKHGEVIWEFANGRDVSVIEPESPKQKGYGNSVTIPFDVTDLSEARLVLLGLAETVGARLRKAQVSAKVLAVGIKSYDFQYISHQKILENATDITGEIHRHACQLFEQAWDGRPVRHLGIHTDRIGEKADLRQMDMFDTGDYEKIGKAEAAVDKIRKRYGLDTVKRAVFLGRGQQIDHMAGGISREKRSVDYSREIIR